MSNEKKENRRITISFGEEFAKEYHLISKEKKRSEIVCTAIREYYNKEKEDRNTLDDVISTINMSEENIVEYLKQIQNLLLKMCIAKKTE